MARPPDAEEGQRRERDDGQPAGVPGDRREDQCHRNAQQQGPQVLQLHEEVVRDRRHPDVVVERVDLGDVARDPRGIHDHAQTLRVLRAYQHHPPDGEDGRRGHEQGAHQQYRGPRLSYRIEQPVHSHRVLPHRGSGARAPLPRVGQWVPVGPWLPASGAWACWIGARLSLAGGRMTPSPPW